jgi:hypothetical protein
MDDESDNLSCTDSRSVRRDSRSESCIDSLVFLKLVRYAARGTVEHPYSRSISDLCTISACCDSMTSCSFEMLRVDQS